MGVFLPNTTSPDAYPSSPQLGGLSTPYERGQILIANNPVVLTVYRGSDRGSITEDEYSYVTPSLIPLVRGQKEYIYGVKFRNAITGTPAQVSGYLIEPGVAGLGAGSAFTQQVASSGTVTPGLASVEIQKNGVLIATEPIIDFVDANGVTWTITDDPTNTRITVQATSRIGTSQSFIDSGSTDFNSQGLWLVEVSRADTGAIIGTALVGIEQNSATGFLRIGIIGSSTPTAGLVVTFAVINQEAAGAAFRISTAAGSGITINAAYRRVG